MIWCQRRKKTVLGMVFIVGNSHAITLYEPEILKIMGDHGCAHLVYGYEHFDDRILKQWAKDLPEKTNIRSFFGLWKQV